MASSADFKFSIENIKLEELTTISIGTETLKFNFEIILHALRNVNKRLDLNQNEFKESNKDTSNQINQLNNRIQSLEKRESDGKKGPDDKLKEVEDRYDKALKSLTNTVETLRYDVNYLKDDMTKLKDGFYHVNNQISQIAFYAPGVDVKTNLSDLVQRAEEHEKSMQDMLNKIKGMMNDIKDNKNTNIPAANNIEKSMNVDNTNNFNKDDISKYLNDYVSKKELEDIIKSTNMTLGNHQNSIDELNNTFNDLNNKINKAVDCDTYDEHLNDYNKLKMLVMDLAKSGPSGKKTELLNQLAETSGPNISTRDMNMIKEISTKFPEMDALLKKLQKDFSEHLHQYKIFADESTKKTASLDDNIKRFRDEVQKRLSALEDSLKNLQNNTDKSDLHRTSNAGGSKEPTNKGGHSSNDLHELNLVLKRIQSQMMGILDSDKERDSKIQKLVEDMNDLKQLKIRFNNLNELCNENRTRIVVIEEEITELKNLKEKIAMLESILTKDAKKSKKSGDDGYINSAGVNLEEIRRLISEAVDNLRNELMKIIEELNALFAKKVNAEDLWKSESLLLEKLDQVVGGLIKKLADKNDTKKALMYLEKKIKEINLIIFGDPSQGEDGAMFAKKPWTPWTCASCDSKLQKYPGALVDQKNWNKFPPNNPSPERMTQGKFGKGWGKWADKQKNLDKSRDNIKDQQYKSTVDSLPDIHQNTSMNESILKDITK